MIKKFVEINRYNEKRIKQSLGAMHQVEYRRYLGYVVYVVQIFVRTPIWGQKYPGVDTIGCSIVTVYWASEKPPRFCREEVLYRSLLSVYY